MLCFGREKSLKGSYSVNPDKIAKVQVITQNTLQKEEKGNNSTNTVNRVVVLSFCTLCKCFLSIYIVLIKYIQLIAINKKHLPLSITMLIAS